MDYDQTEGLGGISVSSYESVEDERSPIDPAVMRSYPYNGEKQIGYPLPDQIIPYSTAPIYPSIPYQIDELGRTPRNYTSSDLSWSISPPNGQLGSSKYSSAPPSERIASALSLEDQSRRSAEEDKRRRNTAASARFRVKKKQREQTLERTVQEATEMNASLEARVAQLEMENRWLKNLLTEKNENMASRQTQPPEKNSSTSRQPALPAHSTPSSGQKPIQPKRDMSSNADV